MNKQFTWKFVTIAAVILLSAWAIKFFGIQQGLDLKGGVSFLLRMETEQIDAAGRAEALQRAADILGRRLNLLGVKEPIIQVVGQDRILVQLPGLKEEDRTTARKTIEQTAYLEFRLVHEDNDKLQAQLAANPRTPPPLGWTNRIQVVKTPDGRTETRGYFVRTAPYPPDIDGKGITRAFPQLGNLGEPYVAMTFNSDGAKKFARVVAASPNRQLAIILDGEVQSAPVIQPELSEDARVTGSVPQARITGRFTKEEVRRLSSVLENPLEAPVKVLEQRSVDPSLGKDSIRSGTRAAIIGAAIVVVFMLIYYFQAGLVANLAMVVNLLVLVGVLAAFQFTLTLPGIAGIVLAIGMSVDANVLIYERIREELAAGKPLRAAIAAGYQRAWLVIFDSNLTTILTAVILIFLGSGPVKGFGVTLTIGLIANLFAAVFLTRVVFDWLVQAGWLKSFNMLALMNRVPKLNFLGIWKLAFIISWIIIIAGTVRFYQRGGGDLGHGEVYGIDFKGGDAVTLSFAAKHDPGVIGSVLDKAGIIERFIQYQRDMAGTTEVLNLRLPEGATDKAVQALQTDPATADMQLKVLGTERVGAVVGKELLKQALWAVAAAMLAIMIYIAFRFGELSYGLGAVISLVHDVLMTIGWFCLTGRTFSMPVMAAVLTLIGYSINDTIVVYDRIRENKKLSGGRVNYFDLINRSINETLSRTLLTGGSTFFCALALYGFGGSVLNDFAFCFVIGVVTGTYSSIYIASPVVLWFHRKEARSVPAKA
jgi:SecD/SecF fusion protein